MAAIALPTCPLPDSMQPFLRDFGGHLTPFLGGPEQRINRIGTRFGVRYTMPLMESEEARAFIARLMRGRFSRVLMPWPATEFDFGDPGGPIISASAGGGSAISVEGLDLGYTIREGQFFSIVHSGRRYVHMSTGDVTPNGSGIAAIGIFPPLRTAVALNDPVELASPMIEGLVSPGDELGWSIALELETAIAFSVVESK
jgi:hypothetical protein